MITITGSADSQLVESLLRKSGGILGWHRAGLPQGKDTAMPFTRPRHWLRWLIGGIAVLAVLAVAGPFLYIHFFNGSAPAALSLSPSGSTSASASASASAATAPSGPVAGNWTVGSGSVVGYRVNEVLLGQNATAVGRSSSVTGHLTVKGSTATAASFSVPMDTIHSDKSQRDGQFDGRIMDVAQYPTGTFTLTSPVDLAPLPAAGQVKSYTAQIGVSRRQNALKGRFHGVG
jgi:YceI-like domain